MRTPLSEISHGSLSADDVAYYREALTRHYAEPVKPVSSVCNAIGLFVQALIENDSDGPYNSEVGGAIREHGPTILTFAAKSALLGRLIYGDETKLRTKKCPVHKGHWSGCASHALDCGCGDSSDGRWGNITGWLKEDELR